MSTNPNTQSRFIACMHCGETYEQPVAWLQQNPLFRCPYCDCIVEVAQTGLTNADSVLVHALRGLGRPLNQS